MGTPEFPNLGKHCSLPTCQLIDFLPFKCDKCNQIYCLDHRSYTSHQCEFAQEGDSNVIVCPLCARAVRLIPNENPNTTWERHTQSNCDPSNYTKITKKKKCPVAGCKESLTFSNKVFCKDCHQEVCLKHRFGPEHGCAEAIKKAKEASSIFNQPIFQGFKNRAWEMASASGSMLGLTSASPNNPSSKKSATSTSAPKGSSNTKNLKSSIPKNQKAEQSMKSRMNSFTDSISSTFASLISPQSTDSRDKPGPSAPSKNASSKASLESRTNATKQQEANLEVCPQCQLKFNDVSELILHVDKFHLNGHDAVKSVQVGFKKFSLKQSKP